MKISAASHWPSARICKHASNDRSGWRRRNLNEEPERLVRGILDYAEQMRTIIQDLLELAQISSQAAPEVRTDSSAILALALQDVQSEIQQASAQITADPLPIVMVDETRLLRVFQNLIGSALKYCEHTPHIRISGSSGREYVGLFHKR
jgi:light-regulated signal transduction histidine kinase (bacteriophytochrome)